MAVPKAYLTSTKNVGDILTTIQQAQAPKQFSTSFLNNLGFKSSADRLFIGMLKALDFLSDSGTPTPRYFEFLDQTQSARVLADALREAYADLFELNVNAQTMTRDEVKNKLKTLTQGQFSDDVLSKMAATFTAFTKQADFDAIAPAAVPDHGAPEDRPFAVSESEETSAGAALPTGLTGPGSRGLGGLVYNIQIQLPETRDPAVYDALFRSLRTHLLDE
jgi:hypothetical protein